MALHIWGNACDVDESPSAYRFYVILGDHWISRKDWHILYMSLPRRLPYFLPLFPDDELSYLAGFSSIKSKVFIPLMALGHIGGSLGLAYIGSGLSYRDPLFIIWSMVTLVAGFLFLKYYKRLK